MDVMNFNETCHTPIRRGTPRFKTFVRKKLRLLCVRIKTNEHTEASVRPPKPRLQKPGGYFSGISQIQKRLSAEQYPQRIAFLQANRMSLSHVSLANPGAEDYPLSKARTSQRTPKPTLVICGAGIAGVSAAYFLSQLWKGDLFLVDENPPLSFTSDRSSECYRNWWSDAAMLALMNRSIDLMESLARQTQNAFHLNRRGYLYLTAQSNRVEEMIGEAERIACQGAGDLRIHEENSKTYQPAETPKLDGADLLLGNALIRQHFPYITEKAVAALHVRRAGWLSAQQLGMILLQKAQQNGVRFRRARLIDIEVIAGRVRRARLNNGESIACDIFVNAAGPYLKEIGRLLEVDLPVENKLHLKMSLRDHLRVIGRNAPLLIWSDPQELEWSMEEREFLRADPQTRALLSTLPPGAHVRPEGRGESQMVLMLWDYQARPSPAVVWPPMEDPLFAEVVLRGLMTMLPGLRAYGKKMPRPQLDGGYYTHTPDNRPLIGALSIEGAYVLGALSGFGIMAACAAAELLAAQILDKPLPTYAGEFTPQRYQDAAYVARFVNDAPFGQL